MFFFSVVQFSGVINVFIQLVLSPLNSNISISGGHPFTAVSQNAGHVPFFIGALNSPDIR